jgi:hypothetical protein
MSRYALGDERVRQFQQQGARCSKRDEMFTIDAPEG